MRYVFLVNPVAGKGKGPEKLVPIIEEYFKGKDVEYKIIITSAPDDARIKAMNEAQKGDKVKIFACGGDGTFFEVLNGIYGYDNVEIGVIPCGSGNDFLRFFDNSEPFSDVSAQFEGRAVETDVINADGVYCMNICSLGMDAVVADDMTLFKNIPFVSGSMAYKLSIVKTLLGKIGKKAKITVDGKCLGVIDCLFAVCANGTTYGGGYKSTPSANPFDGKLEWLIVKTIPKLKIPPLLKLYEQGKHEDLPICMHGSCSVMEIETEDDSPINLDGEIIHKNKIRFEIVKKAVKFILPKGVFEKYENLIYTCV